MKNDESSTLDSSQSSEKDSSNGSPKDDFEFLNGKDDLEEEYDMKASPSKGQKRVSMSSISSNKKSAMSKSEKVQRRLSWSFLTDSKVLKHHDEQQTVISN